MSGWLAGWLVEGPQTLSVKAALERLVEELSADMTNEDDIIDKARQMVGSRQAGRQMAGRAVWGGC